MKREHIAQRKYGRERCNENTLRLGLSDLSIDPLFLHRAYSSSALQSIRDPINVKETTGLNLGLCDSDNWRSFDDEKQWSGIGKCRL